MAQAALRAGAAVTVYRTFKRGYLNTESECVQQGVTCIPMVAASSGGWGPEGLKALRQLAKTVAGGAGGDFDASMGQLLQCLCVIIRSARARAVLRRASHSQESMAAAIDYAAVALAASIA